MEPSLGAAFLFMANTESGGKNGRIPSIHPCHYVNDHQQYYLTGENTVTIIIPPPICAVFS